MNHKLTEHKKRLITSIHRANSIGGVYCLTGREITMGRRLRTWGILDRRFPHAVLSQEGEEIAKKLLAEEAAK